MSRLGSFEVLREIRPTIETASDRGQRANECEDGMVV